MPRRYLPQSKHWLFTINNYTAEDGKLVEDNRSSIEYFLAGKEVGEEGTEHLQGYCVFVNRKRLSGVKKVFPRAHLEIRRGTIKEAIEYCKKDGDVLEFGTPPVSNEVRTKRKWDSAFEMAKTGKLEEIPKDMLVRYYHAFKRIRQDNPEKSDELPARKNKWIVAPRGDRNCTHVNSR